MLCKVTQANKQAFFIPTLRNTADIPCVVSADRKVERHWKVSKAASPVQYFSASLKLVIGLSPDTVFEL